MEINKQINQIIKLKIKTEIMKSQQQYEFEQALKSLDIEFQIFENPKSNSKLTQNRLNDLQGMVKNCKNLYGRVEERLKANMRNRNYNEGDIKNKLKNYGDSFNRIKDRYRKLEDKIVGIQKQDLIQNRSVRPMESDEMILMNTTAGRVDNINKQAEQTLGIYNEVINETDRQNKALDEMHEDAGEIEHELGMSDQLMRVINNRELLTKLILVLLAGFLGLADFMILVVKMF